MASVAYDSASSRTGTNWWVNRPFTCVSVLSNLRSTMLLLSWVYILMTVIGRREPAADLHQCFSLMRGGGVVRKS